MSIVPGDPLAAARRAVAAFWSRWPALHAPLAASVGGGDALPATLHAHCDELVAAIHHKLRWTASCDAAGPWFCISPDGDPARRTVTELWRRAAPTAMPWRFLPAMPPRPLPAAGLALSGQQFATDGFAFATTTNEAREQLDLLVSHPRLGCVRDERQRQRVLFLLLENLLGEDEMERWLGRIRLVDRRPVGAVDVDGLLAAVRDLARRACGQRWTTLQADDEDAPTFACVNLACKRVDHPLHDTGVEVSVHLRRPNPVGLTEGEEAEALAAMTADLQDRLDADAVLFARTTGRGRFGLCLHAVDGPPLARRIGAWRLAHPAWRIDVHAARDPSWSLLQRWS